MTQWSRDPLDRRHSCPCKAIQDGPHHREVVINEDVRRMALDAVSPALTVRRARTTRPVRTYPSRSRRPGLAISHLRPADEPGEKWMAIRSSSRRDAGGLPAFCSGDKPAERIPTISRNVRSSTSPCTSGSPASARGARGQGEWKTRLEALEAPRKHCARVAHASWPTGRHRRPEQTPTGAAVRR